MDFLILYLALLPFVWFVSASTYDMNDINIANLHFAEFGIVIAVSWPLVAPIAIILAVYLLIRTLGRGYKGIWKEVHSRLVEKV